MIKEMEIRLTKLVVLLRIVKINLSEGLCKTSIATVLKIIMKIIKTAAVFPISSVLLFGFSTKNSSITTHTDHGNRYESTV